MAAVGARSLRLVCLVLIASFLLLNALVARSIFITPPVPRSIRGRIIGQPAAFAHAILRDHVSTPSDDCNESVAVAIVGGGVAGLVAAWTLRARGVDAIVLEYEEQPGGNARWGEDGPGGLKYPWGAHYVPIPSRRARTVRTFFESLGLLLPRALPPYMDDAVWQGGGGAVGSWGEASEAELHRDVSPGVPTCKEPTERLFYPPNPAGGAASGVGASGWRDGIDGLVPWEMMGSKDKDEMRMFRSLVQAEARRATADRRVPFTVPLAECSRDDHAQRLDRVSFAEWLQEQQLTSTALRWFTECAAAALPSLYPTLSPTTAALSSTPPRPRLGTPSPHISAFHHLL